MDSLCAEGRIMPIFTIHCNLLSIDDETLAVRGLGRSMGIYKGTGRMTSEQSLFGAVVMSEGWTSY
ncbi:hypothetical protein sscle_07g060620 [Sclerotinia sclerotiorum 1980 UF-70]|uniref:Uncharacterized protein n=1 Tax=Sclerotinia sclerotiorum (strain ATCC 18683 / 1980 / Ss-1) TaxID=665079 RepID=A0A1D9Q905_SCLS1|nr:hypothetical protein sscle_07g060620 [Sclerotinia sclerotiorum 1980 UF-70]